MESGKKKDVLDAASNDRVFDCGVHRDLHDYLQRVPMVR